MMDRAAIVGIGTFAAALLAGCASYAPSAPTAPPPMVTAPSDATKPAPIQPAEQWLFGSAEAAVLIEQTYRAMTDYVQQEVAQGKQPLSMVLAAAPTATNMNFVECGNKPAAVVFDVDETLIWNMGQARWAAEHGAAFDPKIWDEWERTGTGKVMPLPGAITAVNKLRAVGVTVIANTNRDTKNAEQTIATLKAAGFGDFVHGQTLFLKGDDATGSHKDARRAVIVGRYCVVAMVGDQLGDFSDLFNDKSLSPDQRRYLATRSIMQVPFGKGWFLLPNSTYGPWDRMNYDQTFPAETRWEPKEGQ